MLIPTLEAQRFRRSFGGRRSYSRSFRFRSKSKTRRSIYNKLFRKQSQKVASKGKKYNSRNKALENYRRTLKNHYEVKPKSHPQHIPTQIKSKGQTYRVVFYPTYHCYGYMDHNHKFRSIGHDDYIVRRQMYRRRSGGGFFKLLCIFLLVLIVLAVVGLIIQALFKQKETSNQYQTFIEAKSSNQYFPFTDKNPLLDKIFKLKRGKVITLSDPLTMDYFKKTTDFQVTGSCSYYHSTFRLFALDIQNETDGPEPLELTLFVKQVDEDFALYIAMLDHEASNRELESQNWYHLDDSKDKFSEVFSSEFEMDDGLVQVDFVEYDFGGFYDVISSESEGKPIGICEYSPYEPPRLFDWQHAIVTWEGDWIRCYYAREIHERNFELF